MNLLVNGERREVEALTITDLVKQLDLAPETILIEHNGAALLRSEWEKTPLAADDQLEMLRVAAGG